MRILLKRLTRWDEWRSSKITPMFIAGYSWILIDNPSQSKSITNIIVSITVTSLYLAFGYAINDLSDKEVDRLAGKSNAMNEIKSAKAYLILSLLALMGLMLLIPYYSQKWVLVLAVTSYILAITYSLPPIRFKERGIAGIIVASVSQRVMPLLTAMAIFQNFSLIFWVLILLFITIGFRWIFIHQIIDMPYDEKAKVKTFARFQGYRFIIGIIKYDIIPFEILSIGFWFSLASKQDRLLWSIIPIYGIWIFICWSLWKGVEPVFTLTDYEHPLLGDFYTLFWPILLGILISVRHPIYIILVVVSIYWQLPYLKKMKKTFNRVAKIKSK